METALEDIKRLAISSDEDARQSIMSALHKLAYSMESPNDTIRRYGHLTLQTAAIKIGIDLGLFVYLAESKSPLFAEQIAQTTGADIQLLNRVLRYLSAIDALDEVSKNSYRANHITQNLAQKVTEAGIRHYFTTVAPQYHALPTFLKRTNYKSPTDELHTAFQDAWKTSLHAFSWFADNPDHLAPFNDFMALRRQPGLSWLSMYPVVQESRGWEVEMPIYVNIGGGIGHQCAQFKEMYPDIPGRVILQDLSHSIANALQTPGVENMEHDFFEPQPIKGAKFYYMRGVLHNHPPHKVRKLLENTKSAMTQDSILLIDEMILPETGVNANAASIDMTMLTAFASMERTESQWQEIVQAAGLKLVQIYTYNPQSYESVMDVRLL
ncbi:O-methyl transferase B [Mollisia scopiformis]|uniref:O-methyl transferase B n=1 Tax=Mollisia scopiformis TaxID=149040 RepID=A0A194XEA8_MOLSC|nr:O-methyl transferase B [Mollisia scopiformis]KUJ18479.1 O-methyl transferase B [Mollisia scopiformis]